MYAPTLFVQRYTLSLILVCIAIPVGLIHAQSPSTVRDADEVLELWPGQVPGPAMKVAAQYDVTKPTDNQVAGRRVMRITNVATPEIHVYLAEKSNVTAVPSSFAQEAVFIFLPGIWKAPRWPNG